MISDKVEWVSDELTYFFSFKRIETNKNNHGDPWSKTSNQSIIFISFAPPAIHFSLPQMWGSGEKGAKPNVREAIRNNRVFSFINFNLFTLYLSKV